MAFTAGQKVRASELNAAIDAVDNRIVGRNQRTTDSTGSATIVRVLSVIAPVVAGRTYRVMCDGEVFISGNNAATSQHELRYTTNNTEPTTSSTVLGRAVVRHDSVTTTPDQVHIEAMFHCVSTGTFRVAVTSTRVLGAAGNVTWTALATYPMILVVEDMGDTVTVTGTVY